MSYIVVVSEFARLVKTVANKAGNSKMKEGQSSEKRLFFRAQDRGKAKPGRSQAWLKRERKAAVLKKGQKALQARFVWWALQIIC